MSAVPVNLPEQLRVEVAERVARRGISESAWLEEALREKLAAEQACDNLNERAARGNRRAYEQVLGRVPAADPVPGDELDAGN
jgi:metal-responsive CopG/Arc/MetJ family transcriptional regulator